MLILIIMALGVFIGLTIFPPKLKKLNETLQLACTLLLIFSMGVMLGRRENFLAELSAIGMTSLLLALAPIFFSILFVYALSRLFLSGPAKLSVSKSVSEAESAWQSRTDHTRKNSTPANAKEQKDTQEVRS